MPDTLEQTFHKAAPADVDHCALRFVDERHEILQVRQDVLQPVQLSEDRGAMITVIEKGGVGYAATSDLSESGIKRAAEQAREWAARTAGKAVTDFSKIDMPASKGRFATPVLIPWEQIPTSEKVELLQKESRRLKVHERIVDWEASLWHTETDMLYLTADGGRVEQTFSFLVPSLTATANEGAHTETRSLGGMAYCRQGGLEVLDQVGYREAAPQIAGEALTLLEAPICPSGSMDLLLGADQMILQIHESIGHPLELDRILGDERNYAGTTFVTPDMFGSYRYGSELLNVTYDPTRTDQFASFGFDDEGLPARKEYIIRGGILERGLGGIVSQRRSGLPGVACSRASSWNRPAIDRMANLNLEIGDTPLDSMIAAVERGVYMKTNTSWSIDDSRNKFQFGCEWAQLIEDGRLTNVVRKPGYRGISATFWRSLAKVGDRETHNVMGTPYCGKGEPNQGIRVGHASPACLFTGVDVFGGE